jgi:tetraacyldisaccharide 4'-kinase
VDVLSRGYGRQSGAASRVRLDGTAEEFGDEPLLIAREAVVPVYVARERYEAGLLAEGYADQKGFDRHPHVHILDDGFQHRQLCRDADILLLNREDFQDRLLPAGNLREPLGVMKRADVIAIPAEETELEVELRGWGWQGPIWRVRRQMEVPAVDGPVVAFCGIARPDQFFAGLENAGLRVLRRIVFRDHHRYTEDDVGRLEKEAIAAGATALVTTAKDQVRLAGLIGSRMAAMGGERSSGSSSRSAREARMAYGGSAGSDAVSQTDNLPLLTAGLRIEIEDEAGALDWLVERLRGFAPEPA